MSNQPPNSNNLAKLFIFAIVLVSVFSFFGPTFIVLLVTLLTIFGVVAMRRTADFSHIETAARNIKVFLCIPFIFFLADAIWLFCYPQDYPFGHLADYEEVRRIRRDASHVTVSAICYAAVHFFFLLPMRAHQEWFSTKGASDRKSNAEDPAVQSAPIDSNAEGLQTLSVADELIKWAQLKEAGHVTEDEFNEARRKLLQKN